MPQPSPFASLPAVDLQRFLLPELFQALADPTRLAVLSRLAHALRPVTVTEVAGCCGVHLSGVSRHLALLKRAGLVRAERRGREVFYSLETAALTGILRGLADRLEECHCGCADGEGPWRKRAKKR